MSDDPDDLEPLRALLPDETLDDAQTLQAGERSTVSRVRATAADGSQRSLIVKRYRDGVEGWVRETAALGAVPGAVRVPAIAAVGESVLVVEDLGDGGNVAEALLGDNPVAAERAVVAWAEALAELHVATRDERGRFAAALAERAGQVQGDADSDRAPDETWMPARLREAERTLDRHCGSLGVRIPAGALSDFTGLTDRLAVDGTAALTPADTCPDNNIWLGDRLVLLDFEGAQWRHVAWDLAYLTVPWPGCWCAWAIPDAVVAAALRRYRDVAGAAFPAVADDAFLLDVEAATAGWGLLTAAWQLDYALGSDVELDQRITVDDRAPTRRAMICHRLRRTVAAESVPALAELAAGLVAELERRWGDVRLDLAPAFRES